MLKTVTTAIVILVLTPTAALAHSGVKHYQPATMPQLEFLSGGTKIDASQADTASQEMASVVWKGRLRLAIERTRKGTKAFQFVGAKRYRMPKGAVGLRAGILDGIRLELSQGGQVLQRRSQPWCPSGNVPLRDGDLSPTRPMIPGCGAEFSRYIETGIDRGWADSFASQPIFIFLSSLDDGDTSLQTGPLAVPEPGSYKLKITLDPKRILHVSKRSKMSKTFNVVVSQSLYDSLKEPPEDPVVEAASVHPGILPDLRVMPATNLSLRPKMEPGSEEEGWSEPPTDEPNTEMLMFSSLVWNNSKGRLVVSGRRSRPDGKSMTAYQTITDENGKARRTVKIGKLVWNNSDGHNHWHYDGLARYRILKEDGTRVADSGKIGFCFVNTTPIDSRLFPSSYTPNNQSYGNFGCGLRWSLSVSMEMDGGWGDLYSQSVAGQAFDTSSLPNGKYILEVKANAGPYAKIREKSLKNNTSYRRFEILGEPDQRYLEVNPWEGDSSFSPGY